MPDDTETCRALRARLAELPCPSVALRPGPLPPAAAPLADAFDVVLEAEEELAPIAETIVHAPLAAMALVQLLRHGEGLDVPAALLAESLVYSVLQAGPEFAAWEAARESKPPPLPAEGPAVQLARDGARLTLRFDRPERRNAFSAEMRDGLIEGLQLAACDTSIAEIVLCASGPAFCSGGDLAEFGSLPDPATAHAVRSTRNAARLLAACAERVCARVHGACIGAGAELPAFARRVEAREDAFFQLPELGMGLVPGAGGTVSIPRRIGRQRAAQLALSRQRLDAATALRWGLVDAIR